MHSAAEAWRSPISDGRDALNDRAASLSEGQRGLWVLQKMAPDNGALNIPLCFRTTRALNVDAFKQACRFILQQNAVLADAVADERGVPYRTPSSQAAPLFVEGDISTLAEDDVLDYLKAQSQRPFSLSDGPLMRVHILRRSPTETAVVMVFHHIAWDGNSIPPFLNGLLNAYQDLLQGKSLEGDSGGLNHADFVAWEQEMLAGPEAPMHLAYWKEYLAGAPPFLEMPLDGPRTGASGFANEKVRRRIAGAPAETVRAAARALGITPAAFFLGLYQLLLSRYARSEDIVVGITVAIRPAPEFADVIGYCTNIVPIRTHVERTQDWQDFIGEVQSSAACSLDHAAYPFPVLVRELRPPRAPGRRPIFQLAFNYQNFGDKFRKLREAYAAGMSAEFFEEVVQGVWYEIELMIVEEEESFRIDWKYDPKLFHASTASRMMEQFLALMQSVIDDPARKLGEYLLLLQEEPSANGGADGKEPPQFEFSSTGSAPDSPSEVDIQIEQRISAVWRSVLGRDSVDVNDDFFDAGGDSNLAVVLAERLKEELNCNFPVASLFQYTSIKKWSRYIAGSLSAPRHPWEKSYAPGIEWGKPLSVAPIEDYLELASARWPRNVAIDFYGYTMTFQELRDRAARAANGFQALGVGPGINVGLHLLNTPHYAICFFGVLMAGGRIVNFNPHAAAREIEHQIVDSDVEILVTMGLPPRSHLADGGNRLRAVVVCNIEDFLPVERAEDLGLAPTAPTPVPVATSRFAELVANDGVYRHHPHGNLEDELAVLQYTGGTTGEPKGAMLTHANFSAVPHLIGRWMGNCMGTDSTQLVVLPFFHVFGLAAMVLSIAAGARMVVHLRFEVERVLADIAAKRVTVLFGVPSMFSALIADAVSTGADFSSLKVCGSGGAPLPADIFHRFREVTGIAVLQGYSLTEITDLGTWQPIGLEPRLETAGLPLPLTVVEVVDLETGRRVLPAGEQGEICFTGPQLMKGFWKRPDATAEAFHGGRFHSGDIGFIDQDGYVTLVGRKKELILCGGHNVFPGKIEAAIREHPGIADVAVIGVPDVDLGQMVKAFLVLKPKRAAMTYGEFRRFLSDKLAPYEIPSELVIRESLPKTSVGKLSKKDLLAEESARASRMDLAHADI